ncbi:MAG: DUF4234 domain-containing protein [Saccharofermentanales bacterium]|jgi:hypothetical protein
MRFCINCGKEIISESKFCPSCGTALDSGRVASSATTGQPSVTINYFNANFAPVNQLKTNRSLLKFILLSIVTFGIYGIVAMSAVSTDINFIASRYDGKKTMHYCLIIFVFNFLTFGIAYLVWNNNIAERIGNELIRRGIDYKFGAGTFWLWGFLGALIIVGPFIYLHKLLKSMNLLAENYNING